MDCINQWKIIIKKVNWKKSSKSLSREFLGIKGCVKLGNFKID